MKKLIAMAMAVVLTGSAMTTLADASTTGPRGWYTSPYMEGQVYGGSIYLTELNESGSYKFEEGSWNTIEHTIFEEGNAAQPVSGAVYDKASNTLTLKDFDGSLMELNIFQMGDDFKIKVDGTCKIGRLFIGGDVDYSSSLNITGTGTLLINDEGKLGCESAPLQVYAHNNDTALNLGANVTVKIYPGSNFEAGYGNAIQILYTTTNPADKAVILGNGQSVAINSNNYQVTSDKYANCYYIESGDTTTWFLGEVLTKASDPDGLYTLSKWTEYEYDKDWNVTGSHEVYQVSKYEYNATYNVYKKVRSFGNNGVMKFTKQEFEATDFSIKYSDEVTKEYRNVEQPCDVYRLQCYVYQDEQGNRYGVFHQGDWFADNEEEVYSTVFDYSLLPGQAGEFRFTKNNNVAITSLTKCSPEETVNGYILNPDGEEDHNTLGYQMTCSSDPDGLYVGRIYGDYDEYDNFIEKECNIYRLTYDQTNDIYLYDTSFHDDTHQYSVYGGMEMTMAQLEASDYAFVYEEVHEPEELTSHTYLNELSYYPIYTDNNGKEYCVQTTWYNDTKTYNVYDMEEFPGFGDEDPVNEEDLEFNDGKYYLLSENTTVDPSTLTPVVITKIYDNIFNYSIKGSPFIYTGSAVITDGVKGDTNGNGEAAIEDALMIARYDSGLTTLTDEQLSRSDVTGEGDVDIADALKIARFDAGLISSLES